MPTLRATFIGLKLFARIDHTAGAASVGRTLRPTEVFVFGNPQGGRVWVGYNDPAWISARDGAAGRPAAVNRSKALSGLVGAVTAP